MASDKPQSKILDLLYDDELDAESRLEARREVEQSDEARQEFESFESMLDKIRDVDLDEDVPSSVHDSIMAAAREHTAKKATRQAQVTERAPTPSKSAEKSLWSRLHSSGATQLALAAAVVLVGGFIFINLGGQVREEKFHAAEHAVDSQVTFGGETEESAKQEFAKMEPAPQADDELDKAPTEEAQEGAALEDSEAEPAQPAEQSAKEKPAIGEIAQLDQKTAKANEPLRAKKRSAPSAASTKRAPRRTPTRKSRARTKSDNDVLDMFGGNRRSELQQNREPLKDSLAKAEAPAEEKAAPAKREDTDASDDSAALGQKLRGLAEADDSSASTSFSLGSASGSAEGTASKPVPARGKREQQQQQTSQVSSMESDYRSGNYAGVVTQADRYLSRSSGQKADEARVLELKARALVQQGKNREADQVYAELQKEYPSYRSAQIERERRELAEKRKEKLKKQRRKAAERSYDSVAPESESEAAEPASQPSSIDLDQAY